MKGIRHIRFIMLSVFVFFLPACDKQILYNPSENLTNVPVIEILIDEDEYSNLLGNKTTNTSVPIKIIYAGNRNVITGFIRSSGGGSRHHPRWSYRVKLNYNYKIEGLSDFSLSAQTLDPTMIHTTIVTRLFALRGLSVFRHKHVFLKINNRDAGLYLIMERVEEAFFTLRNIPVFEIYKAVLGADLTFNAMDHPHYTYEKKLPEDNNYTNLFQLIYTIDTCSVDNIETALDKYVNIDNYLQYHAISSMTNNIDAFMNNYYLYRENASASYNFVPWDFDRAFDPQVNVGIAGENTLFNKLMLDQRIREEYISEINYNLDNYFREDIIFPIIDSTASHISGAYYMDPYLGGGGYNFNYQVNALKQFISERIKYIENSIYDF